ncbi:RNA polymerase sigma-70 factor [Pedobacter fastidiosus]|uniref:RNA polymerase sigma-70 factor n=1 Tax=Pedobacter fastidiosus TaxID=2765361 RepID=A0ABR7KWG9_9SPHI|nr:RNA polymerase sigma-70 factor [Pedobacter fastidiosus]MBC6112467.1 RNA polymerase sigma-70 factor [Pedobacter fastidiosus]
METAISDQEILNAISMKDIKAFDGMYRCHYKRLYILSFRHLRSQEMAEEIVHDVFIKIWNLKNPPVLSYSLSSYLSKAVVNTSLNALKHEKTVKGYTDLGEIGELAQNDHTDEAEALEMQLIALERAIEELPEQCRKVLLMSKFEKLKQQDIAYRLDISIKTVKNHLTYGYKKLKEHLEYPIILIFIIILTLYRSF